MPTTFIEKLQNSTTAHLAAFIPRLPTRIGTNCRYSHVSLSPRKRPSIPSVVRCVTANPNEVLTADQLQEWNHVVSFIQKVDPTLQSAQADKLVGRAFGWGTQKFWRGDVKEEPPSLDSAEQSVEFLREVVSLDDATIAATIKSFPEVLRLTVERMQENIDYIQRTYPNVKGQLLINTVKGTPAVLGYDYDCEGDCQSECARCWVQF